MLDKFMDILLGEPLSNEQGAHEKYNVPFGLAIMASDAVSSVAYAAEEILFVLVPVLGVAAFNWLTWTSLMIIGLLLILTISYIQIIRAYPHGGGAYIVAKENLGVKSGLVAGAALLIDYVLTVAVSASASVAAITSAFSELNRYKVLIVITLIIILTILNLRGISESSKIFSVPTYIFIVSMIFMILYGLFKFLVLHIEPNQLVHIPKRMDVIGSVSVFLILKAFASGCSALTGLEAVSNSVPNFKQPAQKNAKIVMILLTGLILFIFGGSSFLARFYQVFPLHEGPTVIAQLAYGVFNNGIMFYVIQFSTAIILLMACNTAFTGFPMLMYVVGKDGYAPRQFTIRGKRLSFTVGIVALAFVACFLVIAFNAETHLLIPLYSVGVFMSFTLAQAGMVIYWRKSKETRWRIRASINGFGAFVTLVTTGIIAYEKFIHGAWIVIILVPMIVYVMVMIHRHYSRVACRLRVTKASLKNTNLRVKYNHIVVVPLASLNSATIGALQYAQSISSNVIALNISTSREDLEKLKHKWELLDTDILLVAKYSAFRAVVTPILDYIDKISNAAGEDEKITVILPEFETHEWWGSFLHNHTGFFLRETLLRKNNIVVATYPYHLSEADVCELEDD
ncbi:MULTISPECIES: APC family permease [Clostridium]|uniref:APC family permease n=1 Tax=Clostridium paridis TaxID=2803863 RepID=A0A937FF94_9CLOT|nr:MULTISPECIES: APC family permease [Clostridium]MBL4930366.1 APC family permease [Clostridium paridis]